MTAGLTGALLRAGLVDEVRLMVNPIILGGGLRAFETAGTVPLRLIRARPLTAGNVLLYYRPDFTGRQFRHERSRKVARPVWKVRT